VAKDGPTIACPNCGESVSLDHVLTFAPDRRLFVCPHCRHRAEWDLEGNPVPVEDEESDPQP
jgi:endogenous inhibitor of DNA gyrase (YacG/DUF329 family)